MPRVIFPALLIALLSLAVAMPKLSGVFSGIVAAYIGLLLLNVIPFCYRFRFPGQALTVFTLASWALVGYGWSAILSGTSAADSYLSRSVGLALMLVAIVFVVFAIRELLNTADSIDFTSMSLQTDGVYAVMRHPQYVGGILFLCGLDLYYWPVPLLISTPLWVVGFVSAAAIEEKFELVSRFGDAYIRYCEAVPGLIPNSRSIKKMIGIFN